MRSTSTPLLVGLVVTSLSCSGATRSATQPNVIRLIDRFNTKLVSGTATSVTAAPRTEWRFDGAPAATGFSKFAATGGVEAGPGVADFAIRDGFLVGRTTEEFGILRLERNTGLDSADTLHSIEIRMRVSAGANISLQVIPAATVDLADQRALARRLPWLLQSPLQAGTEMQTYVMTPLQSTPISRTRQILIRPTDAAGATFAIESVRLVTRTEHLASIPSGVGWQGLREMYRETLVAHAPETLRFDIALPERPWLDLSVGTVEERPVTFRVTAKPQGATDDRDAVQVDYTVTSPYRWDPYPIDLLRLAGRPVTLSLELLADTAGALGFWGTPVLRSLGSPPTLAAADGATAQRTPAAGPRPQGVILIQADTLRRDHLNVYGHSRETAPVLARMAREGVLFTNTIAQGSWTKVSSTSILTGLYPTTHGVHQLNDRLPSSATTVAEVYKTAGYATLSLSSVPFTGQYTNLHQGFEELHESSSLSSAGTQYSSKTAREYVDRLLSWVEQHREVPFFAYLHVFDPHSPYEPFRPYNALWSDEARMEEHRRQVTAVTKVIEDPFMRTRGLPTRAELVKAGFAPEPFVQQLTDWYDGSIRAMDVEIGRLFEQLRRMGLDDRTLVVLTSDHGTEFHDHGRFWHGQSVYGELINLPLIMRWPTRLPAGRVIDDLVQSIDIMPTLLDLSSLAHPAGVQGQSLQPFLVAQESPNGASSGSWPGWQARPALSERVPSAADPPPEQSRVSQTVIDGNWKLIHNTTRSSDLPEFELFDYYKDPLNKQNVAGDHPEVVARLAKVIAGWREMATAARVKPDAEAAKTLSVEELQRLRSLGYVR